MNFSEMFSEIFTLKVTECPELLNTPKNVSGVSVFLYNDIKLFKIYKVQHCNINIY